MQKYRLLLTQVSMAVGEVQGIGVWGDYTYCLGENLSAPFEAVDSFPRELEDFNAQVLAEAKARKLEALNASYETFVSTLAGAPQTEILTWSEQEAEAKAYTISKQETDAPMLSALSQTRGVPLSALAQKVIKKAEAYRSFIAYAIGKRQAYEDAIESAQTLGALESIHINFTPPQEAQETESQEILANTEVQG